MCRLQTPQNVFADPQMPQNAFADPQHAKQVEWRPCGATEERYEDLTDLSSIDGTESPPHEQLKEYAAARRAARKPKVVGTSPVEPLSALGGHAPLTEPTEPKTTEPLPTHMDTVSVELVPCAKQEAGLATETTQQLRRILGNSAAKALLSQYTQAVLRDRGKKQRYWVDAKGMPLKLVHQKNVAP